MHCLSVISAAVMLVVSIEPLHARCGTCEEDFDPWPMKIHTLAEGGTDYACTPHTCHEDWKAGSCLSQHDDCSGGGGDDGIAFNSSEVGVRLLAQEVLPYLTPGKSNDWDLLPLKALITGSTWTLAAAPDGGLLVLGCNGLSVAYLPLPEASVKRVLAVQTSVGE